MSQRQRLRSPAQEDAARRNLKRGNPQAFSKHDAAGEKPKTYRAKTPTSSKIPSKTPSTPSKGGGGLGGVLKHIGLG